MERERTGRAKRRQRVGEEKEGRERGGRIRGKGKRVRYSKTGWVNGSGGWGSCHLESAALLPVERVALVKHRVTDQKKCNQTHETNAQGYLPCLLAIFFLKF